MYEFKNKTFKPATQAAVADQRAVNAAAAPAARPVPASPVDALTASRCCGCGRWIIRHGCAAGLNNYIVVPTKARRQGQPALATQTRLEYPADAIHYCKFAIRRFEP